MAAWRVALEARGLGAVSINVRITAVRKLAVEAADNEPARPRHAPLLRYPGRQGTPNRPMRHFARVEVFESGANSFYDGFTLALKRRFARHYQVNLAYTYSKAIDDVTDFSSVVPFNSIDEGKTADCPTLPGTDRGASVNDQRHRVITNFVWSLGYFHRVKNAARYLIDG